MVDIISLYPFFFVKAIEGRAFFEDNSDKYVNGANLFSLFRLLRFERFINYLESEISKQLMNIIISVISLVLVSAASV
jgi:hypothetical protein